MSEDYSLAGLRKFLDYAGQKGLMAKETANARKTAAEKILGVLEPSEVTDLRQVDLEMATHRFMNLQGTEYKPESLRVYASRVKSAVADFTQWVENPSTYKPSTGRMRSDNGKKAEPRTRTAPKVVSPPAPAAPAHQTPPMQAGSLTVPVPIRSDLYVTINGIPPDLTADEAEKIANVIRAFGALRQT